MFYQKKTCKKKLQQSKDWNIYLSAKNLKSKLVLQKTNIKNLTMLFESNKKEEDKTKNV